MARVRETALGAYALRTCVEQLVEALQPFGALDRSPLFQVMLALQNTPAATPGSRAGHDASAVASGTAKFDLTLSLTETADGGLASELQYEAGLFEGATASRCSITSSACFAGWFFIAGVSLSSLRCCRARSALRSRKRGTRPRQPSPAGDAVPEPVFAAQVARTTRRGGGVVCRRRWS